MFWDWSYSMPNWAWWLFPFQGLMSFLFTVAIIILVVLLLRRRHLPYQDYTTRSQALQILEERYAKGEIQREEYLQKKQDLRG
ncbi:MAG TPA: SHOCT domain-containing protein [Rhizomicrobium sp.]|nr:SHOCT domain-containing protein [Rhizomicrobium sp.]